MFGKESAVGLLPFLNGQKYPSTNSYWWKTIDLTNQDYQEETLASQ